MCAAVASALRIVTAEKQSPVQGDVCCWCVDTQPSTTDASNMLEMCKSNITLHVVDVLMSDCMLVFWKCNFTGVINKHHPRLLFMCCRVSFLHKMAGRHIVFCRLWCSVVVL